jgi:hypothetical protein
VASLASSNRISTPLPVLDSNDFLYSWKEMAVFLKCGVRTLQRWEKSEDLPVHRHRHWKRGTVYALKSELQRWLTGRELRNEMHQRLPNGSPIAVNGSTSTAVLDSKLLYLLCEQARERAARARSHFAGKNDR